MPYQEDAEIFCRMNRTHGLNYLGDGSQDAPALEAGNVELMDSEDQLVADLDLFVEYGEESDMSGASAEFSGTTQTESGPSETDGLPSWLSDFGPIGEEQFLTEMAGESSHGSSMEESTESSAGVPFDQQARPEAQTSTHTREHHSNSCESQGAEAQSESPLQTDTVSVDQRPVELEKDGPNSTALRSGRGRDY